MQSCGSIRCLLLSVISASTALFSNTMGVITGDPDGNYHMYAALVSSDGTLSPFTLPLENQGWVNSCCLNASGYGFISGFYAPEIDIHYLGYIQPGGVFTELLGPNTTIQPGYLYSVAINASGNGIVGGSGEGSYAAFINNGVVSDGFAGLPGNYVNSVAINSSGTGLIGGGDADDQPYFAAFVDPDATVHLLTLDYNYNGEMNCVSINDSGAGLVGGYEYYSDEDEYYPFVASLTYPSTVTYLTEQLPFDVGRINSVSINASGNGLIGGGNYNDYSYYAAYVSNGVLTNLFAEPSEGEINSVAINDAGEGLLGGYTGSQISAWRYSAGALHALELPEEAGIIDSVAISQAGVGMIGGSFDMGGAGYAALVAPNGAVTPLDLGSITQIYSVAITDLGGPEAATPSSIGLYSGAMYSQLSATSALQARLCQTKPFWKATLPSETVELDFPIIAAGKPLTRGTVLAQSGKNNQHSVWIAPFGDHTRLKKSGSIPQYTNEIGGLLAAYDYQTSNSLIGVALGYSFNYLHYSLGLGHGKIQEEVLSLYGSYRWTHFEIDACMWGGLEQCRNERHTLGVATSTASVQGWLLDPHLGFSFPFAISKENQNFIEPFVMFDWVNNWQNHFMEHGASGLNVSMKSLYASLLQSEAGLRFYEQAQFNWGRLLLEEKLSYINQAPFHVKDATTFFVGSDSTFPVAIASSQIQNLGSVDFEMTFAPKDSKYPYGGFSVTGMFGSGLQSVFVSLNFGKEF